MVADLEERRVETKVIQAKTKAMRDKRMEANMNAWWEETTADREATEVNPEKMETCPEIMQSTEEHLEVPKEGVALKSSGTVKKWHRGQNLAAGCCGKPKELTRGDCGSQRKLAATCRKVSHYATV
jgi:hypothetical protein